ncbi:MAG: hypothetical protein U1E65_25390 [Myxococcota bacterium]
MIFLLLAEVSAFADPLPLGSKRDLSGTAIVQQTQPHWARIFAPPAARDGALGAPTIEVRKNFVYIEDTDGTLHIPYRTNQDVQDSFDFALREFYTAMPDEFVFLYLFTSFETGIGAFFYSPQANDTSGIGQQIFDQTGPSPLEGFVFMNDWQSFNKDFGMFGPQVVQGFSHSVFNQEAGHRWGFIFESPPPPARISALLGRDQAHWSYFAHTGGSPMEGNAWRDNMNGSFTTTTDVRRYEYCDLDLYLMGLIPADQVRPWFLISNPQVNGLMDIYGQALQAASPPQIFQPLTIRGTRSDYAIEEIVQYAGDRSPTAGQSPTRFRVAFIMLASQATALSDNQKQEFETMVDSYAEGFHTGTRQLASFDYILNATQPLPIGSACDMPAQCDPSAPLCQGTGMGGAAICTKACTSAQQDCPTDWCCGLGADMNDNVCQPAGQCAVPPPDAGPPDTGTAPDAGADPDASSTSMDAAEVCTCDLTTACDQNCACDPECRVDAGGGGGGGNSKKGGCSCGDVAPGELGAFAALAALGLLRRRRPRA